MTSQKATSEADQEAQDIKRCRLVEEALYRRARGYKIALKKSIKVKRSEYDSDTGKKIAEREELETGIEEVHIPADVRVCAYYLNNRDPARWREHPGDAGGGDVPGTVAFPPVDAVSFTEAEEMPPEEV